MAEVKLVVMYPRPKDIDAFEKVYQNEHVPLAVAVLGGKTKIVGTKVLASPQGTPAFYRIAEIHFRSMADLEACAASDGGKQALAHAVTISSGGPPIFLVAEEETVHVRRCARRVGLAMRGVRSLADDPLSEGRGETGQESSSQASGRP